MSTTVLTTPDIQYPDDDELPMSDNTLPCQWIVTIHGNLAGEFRNDPQVFVAGNLLWYPVEGQPAIRTAPDILIAFGRPKGYRGSYKQWLEDGIAPQVVWEILSPGNRAAAMQEKFEFYERHGVEEYYCDDPDSNEISGWVRVGNRLQAISPMHGRVSPRLGIRFDASGDELVLYRPNGQRILTFEEVWEVWEEAEQQAEHERQDRQGALAQAEQEHRAHEETLAQAGRESQTRREAEQAAEPERRAKVQAELAAEKERRAREEAQRRADQLAERLRALGIDPEATA